MQLYKTDFLLNPTFLNTGIHNTDFQFMKAVRFKICLTHFFIAEMFMNSILNGGMYTCINSLCAL